VLPRLLMRVLLHVLLRVLPGRALGANEPQRDERGAPHPLS
tara:strand:+ start:3651 stop:3773 length:123 start_codon:yes stop_codon:yes gene_type:complete